MNVEVVLMEIIAEDMTIPGCGDLMHYDKPVTEDEVPTILFPTILMNGKQHRYAEAGVVVDGGTSTSGKPIKGIGFTGVEPGTVLMLGVNLPNGEEDTGNWVWEDGVTGQNRQITADHSGIYRVTYTNSKGVKSTQMFSIAVRGEGIKGTFTCTANYCARLAEGSEVEMGYRTFGVAQDFLYQLELYRERDLVRRDGKGYCFRRLLYLYVERQQPA